MSTYRQQAIEDVARDVGARVKDVAELVDVSDVCPNLTAYAYAQRKRVLELEHIFTEIWGLAQTDCGPNDYANFPQLLGESFARLRQELNAECNKVLELKAQIARLTAPVTTTERKVWNAFNAISVAEVNALIAARAKEGQ